MKQTLTNSRQGAKSIARHCFSILLCIAICANFIACSNEEELIPTVSPTDDASLLEEQLKELDSRATSSSIVMMILTKTDPSFTVTYTGDITIDWGDGSTELQQGPYTFTHTYTDSKPAHTILLYGRENAITTLDCRSQEIIFLDVTADSSLIKLHCYNNRLTTLDVSKNKKLEWLLCPNNRLTALNISNNPNITYLDCINNYLSTIDISANITLESFYCSYNLIDSIKLSNNSLKYFQCIDNKLKRLDISKTPKLESIWCANNNLSTLDFSSNLKLYELECSDNYLKNLYISKNTDLQRLNCSNNQLEIILLPVNASLLDRVTCFGNPFEKDPQRLKLLAEFLPDRSSEEFPSYELILSKDTDISEVEPICTKKYWYITQK